MKKLSRDAWLAIGLFIILFLVTIAATIQQTQEEVAPPLASFSAAPNGAKALSLWLDELDYSITQERFLAFELPDQATLIFMLEPYPGISDEEWQIIDNWVNKGGTLVVAGNRFGARQALEHYQFNLNFLLTPATISQVSTPLFDSPALETVSVESPAYLSTVRRDFVTHLASTAEPVLVSFPQGEGQVILSATAHPFSNVGLKERGNPALILNLVTLADPAGMVWFDEWHHGQRLEQVEIIGPWAWLRYTPAGRAILLVGAIIFLGLALQGRLFGRPVPPPQEIRRRSPLEYTSAIANLNRRAGHRTAVLGQYREWLKRGLGQRYRLNPTLPDEEYLAKLKQYNANLDAEALAYLLHGLSQKQVSESEMIHLAAEVSAWLRDAR